MEQHGRTADRTGMNECSKRMNQGKRRHNNNCFIINIEFVPISEGAGRFLNWEIPVSSVNDLCRVRSATSQANETCGCFSKNKQTQTEQPHTWCCHSFQLLVGCRCFLFVALSTVSNRALYRILLASTGTDPPNHLLRTGT